MVFPLIATALGTQLASTTIHWLNYKFLVGSGQRAAYLPDLDLKVEDTNPHLPAHSSK